MHNISRCRVRLLITRHIDNFNVYQVQVLIGTSGIYQVPGYQFTRYQAARPSNMPTIRTCLDIFPGRARLAPPWSLRVTTRTPPPCTTCWTFPAAFCFVHFFCTTCVFSISFFFASSVISSFFYTLLQTRFVRVRFSSVQHFSCRRVSLQQQYREHIEAQRNHPCTKQQTKYMPIGVHPGIKRSTGMYHTHMQHACRVRVVFLEMELLAFSGRLFAPQMLVHLVIAFDSCL